MASSNCAVASSLLLAHVEISPAPTKISGGFDVIMPVGVV
jgi:hypothetical protein